VLNVFIIINNQTTCIQQRVGILGILKKDMYHVMLVWHCIVYFTGLYESVICNDWFSDKLCCFYSFDRFIVNTLLVSKV